MTKANADLYLCENCQFASQKWLGKCPQCDAWNSFQRQTSTMVSAQGVQPSAVLTWRDHPHDAALDHISSGSAEFDRVLGGGLVPGQVILLGGEPGVGKSTFLLQTVAQLVGPDFPVAYIGAEESPAQIIQRLRRLVGKGETKLDHLAFIADPVVEQSLVRLASLKPKLLIVDSIQAVRLAGLDSVPGSGGQIRACGQFFAQWSKQNNCTTVIVGQITKNGLLAGPKLLEHLVDTVLYLQKLDWQTTRVLRSTKNRFGPTNEIGFFEMTEHGMHDKSEASDILVGQQRGIDPGSCLSITVQGQRPLLVEVQALVLEPQYQSTVRRVVDGTSKSRVELILAILSRQYKKLNFAQRDVFVKIAGGLTIKDPGIDLAIAMAIISAGQEKALPPSSLFIGELSLLGYVLPASNMVQRASEGQRLGFKHLVMPNSDQQKESSQTQSISHLRELFRKI